MCTFLSIFCSCIYTRTLCKNISMMVLIYNDSIYIYISYIYICYIYIYIFNIFYITCFCMFLPDSTIKHGWQNGTPLKPHLKSPPPQVIFQVQKSQEMHRMRLDHLICRVFSHVESCCTSLNRYTTYHNFLYCYGKVQITEHVEPY